MLPLRVVNNKIIDEQDNEIENIGAIIDVEGGLIKYGDTVRWLENYYQELMGAVAMRRDIINMEDIILVKLHESEELTVEEICTLVNYMILCSANGGRIMRILTSEDTKLHEEIGILSKLGY